MRAGFAALVGRPNVGKSTLLNKLLGEKVAIVSPRPQTTRTRILGVLTTEDGQVALVDTPGIHKAAGPLNRFMVDVALTAAAECDVVLFLEDVSGLIEGAPVKVDPETVRVLKMIAARVPVVLVLTKIDTVKKPALLPAIEAYQGLFDWAAVVPVSARHRDGLDRLVKVVVDLLPEGEPLFPPDVFTDQAEKTLVEEYIREQVLRHCEQEIPYSTAVVVEVFDESERDTPPPTPSRTRKYTGLVRIHANVFVERESQKAIVVGKRGQMLKAIGTDARAAIERMLGANVFLSLQVKVEPRWTEKPQGLRKLGYVMEKP